MAQVQYQEVCSIGKLYISFLREDAASAADRMIALLAQRFGAAAILQDLGPALLGADLRAVADGAVSQCAAAVVLIGPAWISADAEGRRWLDDPTDVARLAIAAALRRGIPVAPVLVGGARMPAPSDLPPGLADLAYRQGIEYALATLSATSLSATAGFELAV
jgi:hypothetical protein